MIGKIFLLGILGIVAIYMISIIPKPIAMATSEFLVIFGLIAFVLAIILFGIKSPREKLWWET